MNKIPVGRTIAAAYAFVFTQIGTVIGVAGGPALLYAGADYASRAFLASVRATSGDAAPPNGPAVLAAFGASLVALFAVSVAGIGVTRAVLRKKELTPAEYFPLGPAIWRMFAANLRYLLGTVVLVFLALAVTYTAFLLAGVPLDAPDQAQPTLASVAAALVAWAAFIYVFLALLRMGFLLPAVVASEEKAGLKRSHDLAEGNTWRLLAIAFALVLPILALIFAAASAVLGAALGPDFPGTDITPDVLMTRVENAIAERLLPWEIFNAVLFVLYAGLMYSGAAFAYKAATGKEIRS